jgi:hypothetical protein
MTRRRPPIAVRIVSAFVLAVAVFPSLVGVAAVAAAQANGVTWKIDHDAKTITADVRLTLTPACTLNQMQASASFPSLATQCRVTQEIANEIKANIEKIWNGHKYFCYRIVVKVDVTINNNPSASDPEDRVRVQVDQSPVNIRSFVATTAYPTATWDGNAAHDQLGAENLGSGSSTWRYPPDRPGWRSPNLYAHEAGHILGLHDSYEDVPGTDGRARSQLRAGAPNDVMATSTSELVDQATSNRLAERAGAKRSDLRCGWTTRVDMAGGKVEGKKCDGLSGDWTVQGDEQLNIIHLTTLWNVTMDSTIDATTLSGTYRHEKIQEISASGTDSVVMANASGKARLVVQADGSVLMTLDPAQITLSTTTPYGTTKVKIPGEGRTFHWENDNGVACP